jgi:hypothetical protein
MTLPRTNSEVLHSVGGLNRRIFDVFMFARYYPRGGLNDYLGRFSSVDQIISFLNDERVRDAGENGFEREDSKYPRVGGGPYTIQLCGGFTVMHTVEVELELREHDFAPLKQLEKFFEAI